MQGKLYIVATPIGNLEDITLRALRILKEVDVIFAEDTRVSRKLLTRYEIGTPVERLDAATEGGKSDAVVAMLKAGKNVAYVSDAGTPGISDPGARLVTRARNAEIEVMAVPGASSIAAAVSVSGINTDAFIFLGFPPHKKGRQTFFKNILTHNLPVVMLESPHRILKTLDSLRLGMPTRKLIIARELTKIHEEVLRGTAEELMESLQKKHAVKGEFVLIVTSPDQL